MAILTRLAFHASVALDDVPFEGIEEITSDDIDYAKEFGLVLKLLGVAERRDGGVSVRVFPCFIYGGHPLASVVGPFNAVTLESPAITEVTLSGPGAGGPQTASAVLGDVVSVMSSQGMDLDPIEELRFIPGEEAIPCWLGSGWSCSQLAGFGPQQRSEIQLLIGAAVTVDLQLGVARLPGEPDRHWRRADDRDDAVGAGLDNPADRSRAAADVEPQPGRDDDAAAGCARSGGRHLRARHLAADYVSYGGGNGRNSVMLVDGIDNKEDNDGGTVLDLQPGGRPGIQGADDRLRRGVRQRDDDDSAGDASRAPISSAVQGLAISAIRTWWPPTTSPSRRTAAPASPISSASSTAARSADR